MKAAVLRRHGEDLSIEELELDAPADDEVLIQVVASGVCHSDRTAQMGRQQTPPLPVVLGHEAAGIVLATGSQVSTIRPGDRVVTCGASFCGACEWCLRGHPQHCQDKRRSRPAGRPPRMRRGKEAVQAYVGLGGFAERMLVHERTVAVLPPEMPLTPASLLGCAVVTGIGAVRNSARVKAGQTVVVIGCGGVGLNAVQGARLSGAEMIIAVDREATKLKLARMFGATHTVDASVGGSVEQVRELTRGGADHVLEAVGRPATIEQGFGMLGIRGTLTVVGMAHSGEQITLPADLLMMGERRIQGAKMGGTKFRLDAELYSRLYLDGRLMLDELIAETVPLTDVNRALADLDTGRHARTVLTFPETP